MVSVDLRARQFRQQGLPRDIARPLRETGLVARSLNLRVSESVAMKGTRYTISTLEALKGLGVQLSISNFGTGYSSLSHLYRFPSDFRARPRHHRGSRGGGNLQTGQPVTEAGVQPGPGRQFFRAAHERGSVEVSRSRSRLPR